MGIGGCGTDRMLFEMIAEAHDEHRHGVLLAMVSYEEPADFGPDGEVPCDEHIHTYSDDEGGIRERRDRPNGIRTEPYRVEVRKGFALSQVERRSIQADASLEERHHGMGR